MKFRLDIKKEIKLLGVVILSFGMIAFVEKKQGDKVCPDITISLHDNGTNYFLDNEEIYRMITHNDQDIPVGSPSAKIDLKAIEQRVRSNQYVKTAQAYTDLRGQIFVEVILNVPIARFMLDGQKDFYICESGRVMPVSEKYTSRVLLLSGEYMDHIPEGNIRNDSTYQQLFELVNYIYQDPFWKVMIAQVDIDREGYITLYPQVTKQYIEFGKPEEIEKKFLKLKVFYKKILPYKGWNHYTRVNIEFNDQIVCE
jgi:cell division protein FtsQ